MVHTGQNTRGQASSGGARRREVSAAAEPRGTGGVADAGQPADAGPVKPVAGDFIGYASTYVGAALISGAVVHYPLDPPRFMVIALTGAVLFVVATAFTEFVINRQRATTRAVLTMVPASLALSFGIGSLSGGIQHFEDVPTRAAVLIPVGLALAFIAYVLRYHAQRWRSVLRPAGLALLATAALAFVALHQVAAGMPAAPADDHHGQVPHPAGEAEASLSPSLSPSSAPPRATRSSPRVSTAPTDAGHQDDGHSHD